MRRSMDIFSTSKVTPSLENFLSRRPIDTNAVIICYYTLFFTFYFFGGTFVLSTLCRLLTFRLRSIKIRNGQRSSMNHVLGQIHSSRHGFQTFRNVQYVCAWFGERGFEWCRWIATGQCDKMGSMSFPISLLCVRDFGTCAFVLWSFGGLCS